MEKEQIKNILFGYPYLLYHQILLLSLRVGIPQKVIDKIFQPFFTTKPIEQRIVLGLSLPYDIVKAHGGEIKDEITFEKPVNSF